ncbi:helix-turn-helix transcriptional regulator [Sphingomonas sp. QA11]|uniref:AraC family transcriptional regulator n=1 Tax=Sphingomonas sp. QA11 TaxID=2950605 RepID=UPI00234908ED|nr:helix-turn-helix transcriptional regulator [Sphingomonas sp. QA11]WCM29061.1 helix-turn-helix transcriptional regulator [Sphingomonas sp. QA11]
MIAYGPTAVPLPVGEILVAARGRDPAGHGSLPHRHPEGQLLGSLKGLISVGTEKGVWVVPATHAVWLPPHEPHWARSHGAMDGWTVYVAEDACAGLPREASTIRTSGLLRAAVLRAAGWTPGPKGPAAERVAAVILDEIGGLPVETFGLSLPRDPRMLRVAQALIDDPADDRAIGAWAALACVSERTLSRRFVEETGFSLRVWRQRSKLMRALEMLAEGQAVTTIALDLGYATASGFIALFRRTFGEPPAAYRAEVIDADRADP